MKLRLCYNCS